MTLDVWRLVLESNRDLVIRTDLDYFQDHFVGKPIDNWAPPPITVRGKSKRLRDFVSWMLMAPVVSDRAKGALEELLEPHVQVLPLIQLRGKQYYAINVTRLVDCLDRQRSDVVYDRRDSSRILNIYRFRFAASRLESVPIFKLPDYPDEVFVRGSFVEAVKKHDLRGAAFADPGGAAFEAILRGDSQNVVAGAPGTRRNAD